MANLAYYRVSTADQSIEAQRATLAEGRTFDREFTDQAVSGAVPAADRPGFKALLDFVRDGDTVHVYAIDRLGRDAIDVQSTIRTLLHQNVAVEVRGLGTIAKGVGELIVAVLAQVADMERQRINERTSHGRALAKQMLNSTGRTHRGKTSLGRPAYPYAEALQAWRLKNRASIKATAEHFGVSESTVKRSCAKSHK